MRAQETCIHAVDLGAGSTFTDLPTPFLIALLDDVAAWRSTRPGPAVVLATPHSGYRITGDGEAVQVVLPLATAAAWLVGRHRETSLPTSPSWL